MSRAILTLAGALASCCLLVTADAREVERRPDIIDAAGMVDFSHKPNFTVGSWVKYRTAGSSLLGNKDDYTVTVLIAGEEVWWGEPCFWIETWTEQPDRGIEATASLMSYSAFGDTMAQAQVTWFLRKVIGGLLPDGSPSIDLYLRPASELRLRRANWEKNADDRERVDTLGAATVTVPAGTFTATKLMRSHGTAETAEKGDSTIYYQRKQAKTYFMNDSIPITSTVKVEIDDVQQGKTWLAGSSNRGPLNTLERAQGATVLLEYGHGGLAPRLVAEAFQHPIADRKLIAEFMSLPSEPPLKVLKPGEDVR